MYVLSGADKRLPGRVVLPGNAVCGSTLPQDRTKHYCGGSIPTTFPPLPYVSTVNK